MSANDEDPRDYDYADQDVSSKKDTSSQADESFVDDKDICSIEEISKLFKQQYKIHEETSVTFYKSYVLSLTKDDAFTCVAAGLSDGSVRLFQINSEKGTYIEPPDKNTRVCGLRFVDETPNLLLVGTTNGLVRLIDLRVNSEVCRFVYNQTDKAGPRDILCFDRNSNGRLLAIGTEEKRENVYILLYDLRTSNELFRYVESHQDDVTSMSFHPLNPDLLCSGSTDGLINIFNVRYIDEDEAILSTINTESCVQKVHWHKNNQEQDVVYCTTFTSDFKAYDFDGDLEADIDRLKITEGIRRNNEANISLIDCHSMADNNIMLVAGSHSNNGSILRSCKFENKQLFPYANFEGNSQVVRSSIFDSKSHILITAGEGGFVTLWTPKNWEETISSSSSNLKMKTKTPNKVKPY